MLSYRKHTGLHILPAAVALLAVWLLTIPGAWAGSRASQVSTRPTAHSEDHADKKASRQNDDITFESNAAKDASLTVAPTPPVPARVSVLDVLGRLAVVILCVYGLCTGLRLLKGRELHRLPQLSWLRTPDLFGGAISGGGHSQLRVIESLALGPNRRLYLVEAGGHTLLLGADATGLAALGDLSATSAPRPGDPTVHLKAPDLMGTTPPIAPGDTREFPLGGALKQAPRDEAAVKIPAIAHERRDEASWARKRDLLIQALRDKAGA